MEVMTNPTRNDISLIDYVEHDRNELKKIPKQSPNLVSKAHQESQINAANLDNTPPLNKNNERKTLVPSQSLYYNKSMNRSISSVLVDKQTFRYSLDSSTFFDSNSTIILGDTPRKNEKGRQSPSSGISSLCSSTFISVETKSFDENCDEKQVQERLWNEDVTFCPIEKISEWLGTNEPFRAQVLCLYMQNFDFSKKRLDEAFRMLCSKLYLKAESQQLDRIIGAFAKRFYECNPATLLFSVDVIHAVAYSLLLLNTDLYILSDKAKKMTRSGFVKNTMETVGTLMFPQHQRRRVTSFSSNTDSIRRPRSMSISSPSLGSQSFATVMEDTDSIHSNGVLLQKLDLLKSNISWKSSNTMPHHQHYSFHEGLTRTQRTWVLDTESLLKEMYNAVKARRIDQADIPEINQIQRSRTLPKNDQQRKEMRRRRGHSVIAEHALSSLPSHRRLTEPSPLFDPIVFKEYRQGIVMRKHVLETADKKAKHRQWQLCYLVMTETELIMYKAIQTGGDVRGKKRKSMIFWNQSVGAPFSLQDVISNDTDEWQPDLSQPRLGTILLNHCYATSILPPGWNGQRPHVFRLQTAEGGLWMFESTDMFAIQAWVEAVNFAAAMVSKSPMQGAVSNVDYGWGADWDTKQTTLPVWYPPAPCMIQNTLGLDEQYSELEAQIKLVASQLDKHRSLRPNTNKKSLGQTGNHHQALVNWDKKFHYISHELLKLRCYRDILKPKVIT
ncbi:hypothetical protein G6F46_002783 [Rhizopus delemar]|uniref:SEC7 domain-containing protein n=2 Tax=Rhizopus TaxID=4842 RepID=A0A9P6YL43_RHIOR|nr:hypothetical protein G6F51_001978 [Rhizopus arrhizus]KAG1559074.1 hypothetical protein G6F49_003944 [Rhizopus delemar]KAG1619919.1 hypothetical protein G6F46_002783 [Rhizopus delemar]KAG1643400.1 hypothetical protein G6F44_003861 [Rhizopus delemar]